MRWSGVCVCVCVCVCGGLYLFQNNNGQPHCSLIFIAFGSPSANHFDLDYRFFLVFGFAFLLFILIFKVVISEKKGTKLYYIILNLKLNSFFHILYLYFFNLENKSVWCCICLAWCFCCLCKHLLFLHCTPLAVLLTCLWKPSNWHATCPVNFQYRMHPCFFWVVWHLHGASVTNTPQTHKWKSITHLSKVQDRCYLTGRLFFDN
jgi:hypothetical protein